ncbi:hypothetical protein [Streptomyces sp. NPDC093094]|uniref:hypothetical protein n=1 Tax=Streptomyces sp. NPDC093094 TaxID=3366026 RepID=UPI00382FD603
MRARDLAEPYPFVTTDDAIDAARILADIERDRNGVTLLGTVTAARLMQHFLQAAA